jgi:hypothetical protein
MHLAQKALLILLLHKLLLLKLLLIVRLNMLKIQTVNWTACSKNQ